MRALTLIATILVVLMCPSIVLSSTADQSSSPTSGLSAPRHDAVDSGPVPVPAPSEKALAYYRSGIVLWIVDMIWGVAIVALFLFTGFSARMRNWAQALGKKWFFSIGIYFAIFSAISFVIDLPLSYYEGFVRQHAYDLSNQTLGKWFGDEIKGLLLGMLSAFLFLWVPYLLLKKSPRRWWLYSGLLSIPFLLFGILVQPVFVDPLFNDFGPMNDKALEAKILHLADRAGIEGGRVYEVRKSEDTKTLNAYVTGFANTKRIVLWDTTIAEMNENELLFVMGHEMGHYVLNHIWKTIPFLSIVILLTLYAIHRTSGWMISRYKGRFGFDQLSDIASLPLLILLFSTYVFVVSPALLAFSRHQEHEADRFGLEVTKDSHDAATSFIKLQTDNLSVPRPDALVKWLRSTHPPMGERIDFCNEYRPWETGEPLKYGHLFKEE
jgi:Zn-dependent protease with chaperone function